MNNFFLSILNKQSKIKKTILTIVTLTFMGSSIANAQVGIGTTTPDAAAVLDLTSTTQGLLPPRMTAAQRDAIATPVQGLMVYCTNCGSNGEAQLYNGAAWVNIAGGAASNTCGEDVTFTYNGSSVTYGTVTGANSKCWMDRNLGADQVALSSMDADSYGDLYQWGRGTDGHQIRTSATTTVQSSSASPGSTFIIAPFNWYNGTNSDDLWKENGTGVNNPCPSGYRLPTETELNAERLSWSSNNASGAWASPLKLPMLGFRQHTDGVLDNLGTSADYWSSTSTDSGLRSHNLFFNSNLARINSLPRAFGFAVRCIKDY